MQAISLRFPKSFFQGQGRKPPVEPAPTAVNSAVVMQAGHMIGFVSVYLLQRTRTSVLDTFIHRGNSVGTSESRNDIAVVRVKSRSRVSRRARKSENPSGQSPRLLALLMCPASPIITNSLPHAVAKACARMTVTNGSSQLP